MVEEFAVNLDIETSGTQLARELKKIIALSEEKVSKGQARKFVNLWVRFHETITKMTGSPRLPELKQLLTWHVRRYRVASAYDFEPVFRAIEGHTALLSATEKGDPLAIYHVIVNHLKESKRDILFYGFNGEEVTKDNKRKRGRHRQRQFRNRNRQEVQREKP